MSAKWEGFLIGLISSVVILINLLPFLHRLTSTPIGSTFLGTQFYSLDFNIYMGHFKEGAEGIWRIHDKHTSEPHEGFLLRREYWFWGYLTGHLLKFPPWAIYHSARITAGFLLLALIYLVIKNIYSSRFEKITCFFLTTLIAGFPKVITDPVSGHKSVDLFLFWFLEFDPASRFATLFHYLIGGCLLLGFILLFKSLQENISKIKLILFCTFGILAGLSHPPTIAIIYLTISVYIIVSFLIHLPHIMLKRDLLLCFLFVLSTCPVILFVKHQTQIFPWNEIAKWDKVSITPIPPIEFILSLGPNFFLGISGALLFFAKSLLSQKPASPILTLLFSFLVSSFLWISLFYIYLTDINRIRFMQTPLYLPLAIFTIYLLKSLIPKKAHIIALYSLAAFVITLPSLYTGVVREYNMIPPGDKLIHMPNSTYAAYSWLDTHTNPQDVVLATFYSATLLPGQSGNTSYWGHPWSTVDFNSKAIKVEKFFTTKMTSPEAYNFLKDGHISYVLNDPDSKNYNGNLLLYSNLFTTVYENPDVTIYKVN